MDRWTGVLLYMSYRDPNLDETLRVYATVPSYLKGEMESASKATPLINSAIIGTIGSLDGSAPQPDSAGWMSLTQYLSGSNAKMRQTWRDEIMATSDKDFLDYVQRLTSWEPTLSIAGPKKVLEREKYVNMTLIDDL